MSTDHTSGSSFDTPTGFVVPLIDSDASNESSNPTATTDETTGGETSTHPGQESAGQESQNQSQVTEHPIVNEELDGAVNANTDDTILDGTALDGTAIEFRVLRAGAPVRRLRLTGNRYTFGSAEGCSIRLTDHALRPMHAVLIRDNTRLIVRAYSVPVEVNGTRTTEATLQLGDVLRLGAYQFELTTADPTMGGPQEFLNAPRSVFDPPGSKFQSSPIDWAAGRSSSGSTSGNPARKELPAAEDVIWRERLRREIDQWRDRQADCDRRESRIDERESDLRGRESELWSRAENLYRRESRLQAQETASHQLYEDYSQRQEELISLRESAHFRQEELRQRESEFRSQEFEYRRRLDEATKQLQQSQQQAQAATEAVQRMREQFESLNSQIDDLSGQQNDIEHREARQREEHERLRRDLENARDKAIDAQAESEARRLEAEQRVEEMAIQIESLRSGEGVDLEQHNQKIQESEQLNEKLSQQIEELQQSVADASEESSQLRRDYEEARKSVAQLETLVEQSKHRGDADRESWTVEADELRDAVDQLSIELSRANSDLSELREANEAINARLEEVQQERDDAVADAQSRPSTEDFDSLRDELEAANDQLAQMKRDYDETLSGLQNTDANPETDQENQDETGSHQNLSLVGSLPTDSNAESTSVQDEDDSDAWPTYESSETAKASESVEASEDINQSDSLTTNSLTNDDHYSSDSEPTITGLTDSEPTDSGLTDSSEPTSVWEDSEAVAPESNPIDAWGSSEPDAPVHGDEMEPSSSDAWNESVDSDSSDSVEVTSAWDSTPSQEINANESGFASDAVEPASWQNSNPSDEEPTEMTSAWNQDNEYFQDDSASPEATDDNPIEDSIQSGSLASQLIQDLENDGDAPEENTFVLSGQSKAETPSSWDQEYPEESIADQWSSDDDDNDVSALGYDSNQDHLKTDDVEESTSYDASDAGEISSEEYSSVEEEVSTLDPVSSDSVASDPVPSDSVAPDASAPESSDSESSNLESSDSDEEDAYDDDSIEAYMNRLLKRSGGTSVSDSQQTNTESLSTSQTNVFSDSEPVSELMEKEPTASIDPDAPLVPRSQAPEKTSDLSAMRELANASARSAIGRSVRTKTRNMQVQGMVSFACAFGALCCIGAAAMFLSGALLLIAVGMLCLIAGICVWEGLQSFAQAKQRLRAAEAGELDDEDEALESETNLDKQAALLAESEKPIDLE